jgi:hypothetical protein
MTDAFVDSRRGKRFCDGPNPMNHLLSDCNRSSKLCKEYRGGTSKAICKECGIEDEFADFPAHTSAPKSQLTPLPQDGENFRSKLPIAPNFIFSSLERQNHEE